MEELAPGLYRWTARHPEAERDPEPGSPADWPPDVGCVAYAAPGALVLIDPLVTGWHELDALAEGRAVTVLTTLAFHSRSGAEVAARYATGAPPAGVRAIPIAGAGETMVWIEEHAALVPGDRLLGDLRAALRPLLDLPAERVRLPR